MNLNIKADTSTVQKILANIRQSELPSAMRNTINDTARLVIKREEDEVRRVFDRPTPLVQRPFWLKTKASKESLSAEISIKDVFGRRGGSALPDALEPHIPGFPATRRQKSFERRWLGGYWVPSRSMKLNRYGNVSGPMIAKMLADTGQYRKVSGFDGTTRASKVRYGLFRIGNTLGVWDLQRLRSRQYGALMMLQVGKTPTYRKRFDFFGVAQREAGKIMPSIALREMLTRLARTNSV
jgi:hypothetical protein